MGTSQDIISYFSIIYLIINTIGNNIIYEIQNMNVLLKVKTIKSQ